MTSYPQQHQEHLLVFGASGAIGTAICSGALARGWRVTGVAREMTNVALDGLIAISLDPFEPEFSLQSLHPNAPFTAVCWAQGANLSDSVYDVEPEAHLELYRANVLYIVVTLKALLEHRLLEKPARLCVISSIWQNLARQSKLSYCVTKAALQGLVLSASADLAADGHLINAVLPGALDTPMTRRNLTSEQVERLTGATGFARLPELEDVTSLVCYLCSAANTGITGQFIEADLGFSHVRIV
jgi:3-oxoacyl-[acyl-carrier protein] reductase